MLYSIYFFTYMLKNIYFNYYENDDKLQNISTFISFMIEIIIIKNSTN